MKKVIVLGVIALASLVSCKKDFTCGCSVSADGMTVTSDDLNESITNSTKSDANSKCAEIELESKAAISSIKGATVDCKLK